MTILFQSHWSRALRGNATQPLKHIHPISNSLSIHVFPLFFTLWKNYFWVRLSPPLILQMPLLLHLLKNGSPIPLLASIINFFTWIFATSLQTCGHVTQLNKQLKNPFDFHMPLTMSLSNQNPWKVSPYLLSKCLSSYFLLNTLLLGFLPTTLPKELNQGHLWPLIPNPVVNSQSSF